MTVTGEGGNDLTGLEVITARDTGAFASGAQPFVVSLSVGVDAPSTDPRPGPVRAVSVTMRRAITDGPTVALLGASAVTITSRRRTTTPTSASDDA